MKWVRWNINLSDARWNKSDEINWSDETVQQLKHTVNNIVERFVERDIQINTEIPSVNEFYGTKQ